MEDAFAEEDEDGSEESVVPVDSESPQDELDTGTALVAKSSKKKKKAEARDGVPRRTAAMRALEDTNVGLSSLPQTQLVQQALAAGSGSKKEKKQKEGQAAHELARILTRTLKKKDKRKKDKKDREKKKKKKKKKKKGKGSSDPSSSSGAMSSWETSSNGSSNKELQKSSSSDEEYEAPLRKRAKNKPGSILSLLVEHARDQLDQSSMVGLPDRESKSLTDGIKLTSYFQILLKSKLTGAMAQQREMYHLAVCMDLLRQGKLSGVGDALAARFLCLHQSVLDGNWTAARHMELYPLDLHHLTNQKARQAGCKSPRLGCGKLAWRLWQGSRWKGPLRPLWRRCFRPKRREEGKERKRKRQGSWQEQLVESRCRTRQRRRVEEHAGPEERQVTKTDEVGKLALALEEVWTTASDPIFMEPEQSLRRALNGCSSLRAVGLSLCWLIVAGGFYRGSDEKLQKFFGTLVRDLTVKQPTSGTRRVPGVFPLREGPLRALRSTLRRCSFEECTTNEDLVQSWAEDAWVYLCMVGSNILAGFPAALGLGRWSRLEADAATSVRAAVQRRLSRDVRITPDAAGMDEELKNRHIGYAGEEVSKCHPLSLKQILPSLPPKSHGGSIDALDWLGPRSREFLLHPERCLLPEEGLEVPNLPGRVHIVAEDKLPVAKELVSRSICRWIDLEEVHVVKGQRLLNGLFGVTKPTLLGDKSPVLRVIMNLVPINAITHQLQGAVDSLPAITAWQSLVLDGDETIAIWQSDMSSAFYLFKIPEQWGKYLSFNFVVDGASVGFPEIKKVALCSNVIPMGWSSSVGLMQEMAEALAYSGGLRRMQQIRKGSPIPPWLNSTLTQAEEEDRMWWHVCT